MINLIKDESDRKSMIQKTIFQNYGALDAGEIDTEGTLVQHRIIPLNRAGKKKRAIVMPYFVVLARNTSAKKVQGYIRTGGMVFLPEGLIGKKVRLPSTVVTPSKAIFP